jgi:hypothetical protein
LILASSSFLLFGLVNQEALFELLGVIITPVAFLPLLTRTVLPSS